MDMVRKFSFVLHFSLVYILLKYNLFACAY
jgi:hypothetical protein